MYYYSLSKIERRKEPKKTRVSFCQVQRVPRGHKGISLSLGSTARPFTSACLEGGCGRLGESEFGFLNLTHKTSLGLLSIPQPSAEEGTGWGLRGRARGRATHGKSLSLA